MHTSNRLGEHLPHLQHLQLSTLLQVLLLWDGIGHHDLVQRGLVDALASVAGEDAVGDESVDGVGAGFLEEFGGAGDGVGCICQIVDEYGGPVGDVAD